MGGILIYGPNSCNVKIKEEFSVGRRRVTPETSAIARAAGVAMENSDVDFKAQLFRPELLLLLFQDKRRSNLLQ